MYKVFFSGVPVFFSENNVCLPNFVVINFLEMDFNALCHQVKENPNIKINIICDCLAKDWVSFLLNFTVRKAAGGVVFNQHQELLWIYRFGKWDLPKGHIEGGESTEVTALREVEEECGLADLAIENALQTTYHVFTHKNKYILKITDWFLMRTQLENDCLVPQIEEGITEVCFKSIQASKMCLKNTYGNIKLLLKELL